MKKLAFSAIALFVLAGSSANAITFGATQIAGKDKPKTTQPDQPSTNGIPPTCPYNDPNGCGILD